MKRNIFGNYGNLFFTQNGFRKQKFTLKTKEGVISSETIIAYIFNNNIVNIPKSLNIPEWNL